MALYLKLNLRKIFKFLHCFKGVIFIWLISHVLIFSLGYVVTYLNESVPSPLSILMRQFCRWDAPHYIDIAKNGYVNSGEQRLFIVFFPLYPLLIRLATFNYQYINLSALVVSNISSLIASIYLFKLAKLDFEEDIAKKTILYISIFPTAYFLCAIFTEGLFLALAIASIYYARKERWWATGICSMFATLTRSFGLVLLPTLIVEYFLQRRWEWRKTDRNILWSGMVVVGFAIYLLINYQVTGNFFTFIEIQRTHWYQSLNPLQGLANSLGWATTAQFPENITVGSAQIIFAILGLSCIIGSSRIHLRLTYRIYALFTWLMSVSTGWWISVPRYILTMFPLFILFGLYSQRREFDYVAIPISVASLCFFTILFSLGTWAF